MTLTIPRTPHRAYYDPTTESWGANDPALHRALNRATALRGRRTHEPQRDWWEALQPMAAEEYPPLAAAVATGFDDADIGEDAEA